MSKNIEKKVEPGATQKQTGTTSQQQTMTPRSSGNIPSLFSISPREFFTNPFSMMQRFNDEMERMFQGQGWSPAIEVFEKDNQLNIHAELPGLNKEDVNVEVTDQGLVIKGERKQEHQEKKEGFYRSERSYGSFYRLIPLPEGTDLDKAEANFSNGVLEISIPISARKHRQIEINTSKKETPAQSQSAQAKAT